MMLILGSFYLVNSWQQYRTWLGGTIIVVLSLIAIAFGTIGLINHKAPKNHTETNVPASAQIDMRNANQNDFSKMQASDNPQLQKEKENELLKQMQKNYEKFGTVSFDQDSKTYQITPTGDTGKAASYLAKNPTQAKQIGWSNLTDSMQQVSQQVKKLLGKGYSVSVMNPDNQNQALYTAKDGQQTYNIAK